ncbi:MAG: DUF2332 family protein [Pseudomonadota bacterium]
MTPALESAFADQARSCAALGSPFMARLLPVLPRLIAPESRLGARLRGWPEARLGPSHDSVPLRLAGALHRLHLEGGAPGLSAVYPPNDPTDAALAHALRAALADHESALLDGLRIPPQTNEVRRAAVLIAAGHWLTQTFGKPLILSEIGASAGLNLNWDFFCLRAAGRVLGPRGSSVALAPDWRGAAPDICPPYVAEARGVDLNPLDPALPEDALRLRAFLWPDQPERHALTEAAIALARAPAADAQVARGDALAWLPGRLRPRAGHCQMIYSTIAWQYLPRAARAEGAALISEAGARATSRAPLAWVRMEPDGNAPGAALTMSLWPGGGEARSFGRVDFHGRWVDWQPPAP